MRSIKPNMRHRPLSRTVLLALGTIVIGGVGTLALLGATNVIDLGKLAFWRPKAKVNFDSSGLDRHSPDFPSRSRPTRWSPGNT